MRKYYVNRIEKFLIIIFLCVFVFKELNYIITSNKNYVAQGKKNSQ